jgi:hypothetical protein
MTDPDALARLKDDINDAQEPHRLTHNELASVLFQLDLTVIPSHESPAARLGDPWAAARRLRDGLIAYAPALTMDHLADALSRLNLAVVPRSTTADDRVRAAATGLAVVVGQYGDRSGLSDACYGPYDRDRADAIAGLLTEGNWHSMQWLTIPVGVLPGGET